MNRLLCYNECKNLVRDKLMSTVLVIIVLFTVFALYNGHAWYNQQQRVIASTYQEQQQAIAAAQSSLELRQQLTTPINWWDDVTDLRGYAFYLMVDYAVKPPLPLSSVAVGQSDIFPYFFRMNVGNQQNFIHQHETLHPLQLVLGKFDLTFFIIYILPLLLIAVNFNALTSEKQSGLLQLLNLQGVSSLRLLINQLMVRSAMVLLPFIVLCCGLLIMLQPGVSAKQLLLLSIIVLVYAFFWVSISAVVIVKSKVAAYNASALVAFWLILVVMIPALINTGVLWVSPAPSRIEYVDTLRKAVDSVEKSKADTLAAYFQDHPELAKGKSANQTVDYSVKKLASINAVEQVMVPLEQAFSQNLLKQQNMVERLIFLSPATVVQTALYQLAGNGLLRQQDFIEQVVGYHRTLRDYFQQRIVAASRRGDFSPCDGCNARITFTEFSTMPRFQYQSPSFPVRWHAIVWLLCVALLLSFYAGYRAWTLNKVQHTG